ncbi:hypothetical protein BS17DRAFT_728625 [Gyrodon lividus]|nr:hypothetical protein BS17DRAFT_728625 [Gyrodon lividus]
MSEPYASPKVVNKSYRPRSYVMSPGLMRARAPFRFRNAITGFILASFGVGVWAYSISAVKQDDFSDVDEEAREIMKGRTSPEIGAGLPLSTDSSAIKDVDVGAAVVSSTVSALLETTTSPRLPISSPSPSAVPPRGVLVPILDRTFPRLLDPTQKTLVWGAPPLDNIGRVNLRSSSQERR